MDFARTALESGLFGESAERTALEDLVEQLDEAAWDIRDRVDGGNASEDDYGRAFRRARAANCLWWALDEDPLEAAGDTPTKPVRPLTPRTPALWDGSWTPSDEPG